MTSKIVLIYVVLYCIFFSPTSFAGEVFECKVPTEKVPLNNSNNGNATIYIYVPSSIRNSAKTQRFPVVYLLHAFTTNATYWETNTSLSTLVDRHQLIVVAVDDGDGDSWWLDSPIKQNSQLSSYLCEDVRPFVQNFVSTTYKRDIYTNRTNTGIMGFSMGGFGAFYNVMNHPEIFGVVIGNNACVDIVAKNGIHQDLVLGPFSNDNWKKANITDSINILKISKAYHDYGLKIRFYNFKRYGQNEHMVWCFEEWFYEDNRNLSKKLSNAGIPHDYFVLDSQIGHNYPNRETMDLMLTYFENTFSYDNVSMNNYIDKYSAPSHIPIMQNLFDN